jgi:hypothetical protein
MSIDVTYLDIVRQLRLKGAMIFWRINLSLSAGGKRRGRTYHVGPVIGLVIETAHF